MIEMRTALRILWRLAALRLVLAMLPISALANIEVDIEAYTPTNALTVNVGLPVVKASFQVGNLPRVRNQG